MYGGTAWGWHQLQPEWAQRLVEWSLEQHQLQPGDLVCDLGAGRGALTEPLLRAGAQVVAVEKHPRRAQQLRRRFADAPVTVVECDLLQWYLPHRPFRVVSNPPFALTTPLIRLLTAPGSRLIRADVVLQRAAAKRWATGQVRLGHSRFELSVSMLIPRSAFTPRPRVDAAVLTLRRR